jgi:hypothetical protein
VGTRKENESNYVRILDRLMEATVSTVSSILRSESRCALRLRYVDLAVRIELADEVCCGFTVFGC